MGIGKRAFLYVTRKKVRSVLLLLIFFVTGLFLVTGISIKRSAEKAAKDFQKTLTTGLMVEQEVVDLDAIWDISLNEKGEEVIKYKVPLMMEEHIEEFLAIEGVSGFYCDSMERYEGYTGLEVQPGYYSWCVDVAEGKVPLEGEVTKEFQDYLIEESYNADKVGAHSNSFIQVYDSKWHPAFINGAVELVAGRHIGIHDEAKVVISDEMAKRNGLKIGDKIKASNSDIFTGECYGSVYETEIVGMFHINFEQTVVPERTSELDILANTFFCTPDVDYWGKHEYQVQYGKDVIAKESERRLVAIVLFVEDPSLLDSVKENLLAMDGIDWSYYNMGTYDKDYQTAAAPLLSIMKLCNIMTVISAVGMLAVLFLVLIIWGRSRRYEIRILSSIGVKKNAILQQFLIECCGIAAVAFLVAFLLAKPTVKLVGDGMQTLFYASGNEEAYEVVTPLEVTKMYINLLPPAKEDALSYAVTPIEAGVAFLFLEGTAVIAVIGSLTKMHI